MQSITVLDSPEAQALGCEDERAQGQEWCQGGQLAAGERGREEKCPPCSPSQVRGVVSQLLPACHLPHTELSIGRKDKTHIKSQV